MCARQHSILLFFFFLLLGDYIEWQMLVNKKGESSQWIDLNEGKELIYLF